ncbi:hypothetical protein AVEN_7760-2 [Araneus ventricosus]|uniref:DDE-1 domain-containing protein n=1 Tax=Araneus ventricosus TaxID=182803 RepID=A0A4Y2G3Z6_ARAVE|nr:hypothetical protein AVEN_7760-2 [Araneus ventricosus]
MDNATSHPDDLKLKNICLVFLPSKTISMLQPLDQGIIHSFKVGYRKLLLRHVLSQISSCKSNKELAKSVSVLDAISWTTSALKKVEPRCVLKCLKNARFLSTSEVATGSTTEKSEKELAGLVANLDSNVQVEEYVKIDDDLSIEEENLHVSNFIHRDTTEALVLPEDDDEESPMEDCKIKDYSQALKYSKQLKQFFLKNEDSKGLTKLNPMKLKSTFVNLFFFIQVGATVPGIIRTLSHQQVVTVPVSSAAVKTLQTGPGSIVRTISPQQMASTSQAKSQPSTVVNTVLQQTTTSITRSTSSAATSSGQNYLSPFELFGIGTLSVQCQKDIIFARGPFAMLDPKKSYSQSLWVRVSALRFLGIQKRHQGSMVDSQKKFPSIEGVVMEI